MEEKKRGNGIFLGVVAVATLIVAIIGATFAYFSITAQSDADAVNLSAYEFTASLSVSPVAPTGTFKGLIPMDPEATVSGASGTNNKNLLYAINEATNKCVDSNGYQVCAIYELIFENTASESMTLTGILKTTANNAAVEEVPVEGGEEGETTTQTKAGRTAFTDLKIRTATLNSSTYEFDEDGGSVFEAAVPSSTTDGENTVAIGSVTVPGNDTLHKYIVIYLDGTNDGTSSGVDQSAQMGATYQGQLVYESGAGNQLTGTFNVGP